MLGPVKEKLIQQRGLQMFNLCNVISNKWAELHNSRGPVYSSLSSCATNQTPPHIPSSSYNEQFADAAQIYATVSS